MSADSDVQVACTPLSVYFLYDKVKWQKSQQTNMPLDFAKGNYRQCIALNMKFEMHIGGATNLKVARKQKCIWHYKYVADNKVI